GVSTIAMVIMQTTLRERKQQRYLRFPLHVCKTHLILSRHATGSSGRRWRRDCLNATGGAAGCLASATLPAQPTSARRSSGCCRGWVLGTRFHWSFPPQPLTV